MCMWVYFGIIYIKVFWNQVSALAFPPAWNEKQNKRDTTDRAKRGVWDEKRGKERKKKKISIVFCT